MSVSVTAMCVNTKPNQHINEKPLLGMGEAFDVLKYTVKELFCSLVFG